jgi:uncharacterized protein YkwD
MFRSWMRSSIHRPNILDGRFHEIGISACKGDYGDYGDSKTTMYTADFGAPLNRGQNKSNF